MITPAAVLLAILLGAPPASIEIHLTDRVMYTQVADPPSDHEPVNGSYELTIPPGTCVSWYVESGHHLLVANDGTFTSGPLVAGMTWSHVFSSPGTYRFHDDFHLGGSEKALRGTIHVTAHI